MTDNEEIAELRRSTVRSRYMDEPTQNEIPELGEDIQTVLSRIDAGEQSKMVGVRDEAIVALLVALEGQDGGLVELGNQLERVIGREQSEELTRSDVLRLAVRAGLQEGAPSYLEQLQEASAEYAKRTL